MSPGSVSRVVVADKIAVVRRMLDAIGTLPLQRFDDFSLRYNPIMVPVSAEDAVNVLVDDYRTRCLWFLRADFYPVSREARLRVLDYVQRHGDQDAFVRAAALRQWLLQNFNAPPAAS